MKTGALAGLWSSILHLIMFFSIIKKANSLSNLGNETDRIALLELKARISNDPSGILSSWNYSSNFCKWQGVTCGNKHKRVISLELQGMSLTGTLSPFIRNLTFLRFLDLAENRFHGGIPEEIGHLFRLTYLNLTSNKFEGEIPANMSLCSNLRIMELGRNNLTGKIPAEFGFLTRLVMMQLSVNNLTGEIPESFGNLSALQIFTATFNNLQGNIPNDLGRLKSLRKFWVSANKLTGTIPSALYNLSSVTDFSFGINQFEGTLPPNIGLTLPNLQTFGISTNQIHGTIPISFTNASKLLILDISFNKITGPVPNNLGYLKSLKWLNMENNFLGKNMSRDMDFLTSLSNCTYLEQFSVNGNNLGGPFPSYVANMSKSLVGFRIGRNQIYGQIPPGIGNLVNLYILIMTDNLISGPIPDSLGKLVNLQGISLAQNKLSGEIPQSLCNITSLTLLYLEENKLEGNLTSIGNCKNLQFLNISANHLNGNITQQIIGTFPLVELALSQNELTGLIPAQVGSLKGLRVLDLSENKLSGEIPNAIGQCLALELLYLDGNVLQGDIPSSVASLKGLQVLDMSSNNLSGNIPKELENLIFLQYLNLSFNNLKGEVPMKGVFSKVKNLSLDGNDDLCGGILELQLPACHVNTNKHKKSSNKAIILAAILPSIVIFIALPSIYIFYKQKSRKNSSSGLKNSSLELSNENKLPQISFKELLQATNGFASDCVIGEGSFGTVYRGSLNPQGKRLVAVKVFKLQQQGASKSFLAECKALCNIRHRNLVKILTYCSSIDFKGNDFKALVFDFMENGNLEMWLHPGEDRSRNLRLHQRLQLAIDVSAALHYLHDNCETPIIHCDLKPSNILFDEDMTAHVGDFGLARLVSNPNKDSSQCETSSLGMKGTVGYIAPEYGVGSQATRYGDIYSFGIILLEIFTGRRPTDQGFTDSLNLHNFVKDKMPEQVLQVLDPPLIDDIDESLEQDGGEIQKCIVSVLEIGLSCSAELPGDRMRMGYVNRKLNVITEAFLRTRTL